jgi:hypothetical protein
LLRQDDDEFEEPTEDDMLAAIVGWADVDGDGRITMAEFVRLQLSCGNDTPGPEQWAMLCGALGCVAADGLPPGALARLYEGEGPHADYYTLEEQGCVGDLEGAAERHHLLAASGGGPAAATERGERRVVDERFDELERAYDDDDIGSLGSEDGGARGDKDLADFGSVLDDFLANEDDEHAMAAAAIGAVAGEGAEDRSAKAATRANVLARFGEGAPPQGPDAEFEYLQEGEQVSERPRPRTAAPAPHGAGRGAGARAVRADPREGGP